MSINNKYSIQERKTLRRITELEAQQKRLRKRWLDIDIILNALKLKINRFNDTNTKEVHK